MSDPESDATMKMGCDDGTQRVPAVPPPPAAVSESPAEADGTQRVSPPPPPSSAGPAEDDRTKKSGAPLSLRQPGTLLFGRFQLERFLGKGGMGEVWLAYDQRLTQHVALKFLPENTAVDDEAWRDLVRETKRSRELTHPSIVRVHDLEKDDRTAAIAMEYVDGEGLAARKLRQPAGYFEVPEIAQWIGQLCEALDYAHRQAQIVHRDLKPANIMISAQGALKVMDFGISSSIADSVSRRSMLSGISGTPLYMSPQQCSGEMPAVTDDIYSLGALIYELLTGKPPFYTGDLPMQILQKAPPSMAVRRAELGRGGAPIPAMWEQTVARCLAKEAAARPPSVRAVAAALGLAPDATEGGAHRAVPPPPPPLATGQAPAKSFRWLVLVSALLLLGVAGVLIWRFWPRPAPPTWSTTPTAPAADAPTSTVAPASASPAATPAAPATPAPRLPVAAQPWIVPGLQLEMVPLEAGAFTMGSAEGEPDERPITRVQLTRPFWLGRYEVTQAQWEAIMGANPAHFRGAQLPVEKVSWLEAQAFCRQLTEQERAAGRLPAGYVYALPSEAQWEYACRAGSTGAYAGALDELAWYKVNSGNLPRPVGGKRANAWGLYDMHGNVWEWCRDWKAPLPGGTVRDPAGPASGEFRIFRGGAWNMPASKNRSATRVGALPTARGFDVGFRVALCPAP